MFSPLAELWKGFGKEKERKRILSLRCFPAAGFFLLDVARMLGISGLLRDWRGLVRGKKGRDSTVKIP